MAEHLLMSFCTVEKAENLEFSTTLEWNLTEQEIGVFVIRSEQPLQEGFEVLIKYGEGILWRSPLRNMPLSGVVHPYVDEEDDCYLYLTTKIIRKEDLILHSELYQVALFEGDEEKLEIPLMVEWGEYEQEETNDVSDTSNEQFSEESESEMTMATEEPLEIDSTNETTMVSDEESGWKEDRTLPNENDLETTGVEEQEAQSGDEEENDLEELRIEIEETIEGQDESLALNEIVLTVEKVEDDSDDESVELENSTENTEKLPFEWNQASMEFLFNVFQPEDRFQIEVGRAKNLPLKHEHYEIIIEKMGSYYTAVIHEKNTRACYVLVDGEPVHYWEGTIESYYHWLKDKISKMFNISIAEMEDWNTLFIVDDAMYINEELTSIEWKTRAEVIAILGKENDIIGDLLEDSLHVQITFDPEHQISYQLNHKGLKLEEDRFTSTDVSLKEHLTRFEQKFKSVEPVFLGFASFHELGLQEQSRPFVSLVWKFTERQR